MNSTVKLSVDVAGLDRLIKDRASIYGRTVKEEFKAQCMGLASELIKNTPPFSGKLLNKMLDARGLAQSQVETESARKIGEKAVERDLKKIFLPVKNWGQASIGGKNYNFLYLFSVGSMKFGVPIKFYNPSPDEAWMKQVHQQNRGRRGHARNLGNERAQGNWTVIYRYPVPELMFAQYLTQTKARVGEGKGGWAAAFKELGGRISAKGWIGRHAGAGRVTHNLNQNSEVLFVHMENRSSWAAGGDEDRVIQYSIANRARALVKDIKFKLAYLWGRKSEGYSA